MYELLIMTIKMTVPPLSHWMVHGEEGKRGEGRRNSMRGKDSWSDETSEISLVGLLGSK